MRQTMRGITLIELMIVIVVLSIMVMVAYPNYQEFAARAKRNEARAALLLIATNQERHYLNNNTYTANLATLGVPAVTETGAYNIAVTAANAVSYTARATYNLGGNEAANCPTFQITANGAKTSPDGAHADCWTRSR